MKTHERSQNATSAFESQASAAAQIRANGVNATVPITLDDAALQLGRSKAHLVRSFSARWGVAPHAYLIGKRIEAARGLLLQGVPTAEVATAVGFYDQSHLTRHFKRHTAVPPAAYAASHTGAAPA